MKKKIQFFVLLLLISNSILAQKSTEKIPFDNSTKLGKLKNGLTYYIRKNQKPENKVELRLVVNAGSVLERDDQQGVAHFLEHMAFNGTKNFPKNELLNYLQKTGVRFGADLNATTTEDYTLYMLPISTTNKIVLQNGYQVLRDWAGNLLLDEEEINKERGIIIEEKRMRQNAFMRTYSKYLPILVNGSKYGERIPIGKEEIIKNAPRKAFTDFYTDWYRPNNMAIIVVGDIDVTEAEKTIQQLFADLKNPSNAPVRPNITPITWHKNNTAKIVTDAENTMNFLGIYIGLETKEPNNNTWEEYQNNIIKDLVSSMVNSRLQENSVNAKSSVTYASIDLSEKLFRGHYTTSIAAVVKEDVKTTINFMMAELLKMKQFGFTQTEFETAKKKLLKNLEEAKLEKDKTESYSYVYEYVEHFLNNEPSPGIEAELNFTNQLFTSLSLQEINKYAATVDLNKPAFIVYNAKEPLTQVITENDLITTFENAKKQTVTAYTERTVATNLMDKEPMPGKILAVEKNEELDTKTLRLSNGITVIYKNTNYKNDEIIIKGSQWGGATNLSKEEIKTAKYINLINNMGLGKNKAIDMPKITAGKQAFAGINVTPNQININGMCSKKDVETFMQLLYLKITNINFNAEEFEGIKANAANSIGGFIKNPLFVFTDSLNKFKFNNSPRYMGLPYERELTEVNLPALKALYNKLMQNLNGTVLVFCGNIDENIFKELVEKYIASIPTLTTPVTLNDKNVIEAIKGNKTFTMKGGKENKAEISFSYFGKFNTAEAKEIQAFSLAAEILQMQATEKLREEMGSTYSPKVSSLIVRSPINEYSLSLNVSSAPENADKIIAAFEALVEKALQEGFNEEDLQKAKAQRLKMMETAFKNNNFWASTIEQQYSYQYKALSPSNFNKLVESVTKDDVQVSLKKFLANTNTLKAVMNPD